MEEKTIHLAPIPSDWGDVHVTVTLAAKDKENILRWSATYPNGMPEAEQEAMNEVITSYMKHQHEDLVQLFGE